MFEKEAEERARKLEESQTLGVYDNDEDYARDSGWNDGEVAGYEEGFKDGAEFGYSKANEWHYVKDGDLPKDNEYIIIYSKLADNIAVGKRRCAGKVRRRCVYEWYFATYEGTYCLRDKDIIAWKEIVLPELPKEIKEK